MIIYTFHLYWNLCQCNVYKIHNNYPSENLIKSTKRLMFEVHLHETKKRYGYEII